MRNLSRKDLRILGIAVFLCAGITCFANGTQEDKTPGSTYEIDDESIIDSPGPDGSSTGDIPRYTDNGDGTVSDEASGLMWTKGDSGEAMNREEALAYAENSNYAGFDDWRLPNERELKSIEDHSAEVPALDTSVFNFTEIINEAGATAPDGEPVNNYIRLVRGGGPEDGNRPDSNERHPDGPDDGNRPDANMGHPDGPDSPPGMPDFAAAAEKLGISEEVLMEALGDPRQGPPDFAAAAALLGITEAELLEALGMTADGLPVDGNQGPPRR